MTLAFGRGRADAATIKVDDSAEQTCCSTATPSAPGYLPRPRTRARLHKRPLSRPRPLREREQDYLQAVVFPELDDADAASGPSTPPSSAAALADHLEEALRWFPRAWTLHWLSGPDGPRSGSPGSPEVTGAAPGGPLRAAAPRARPLH